MSQQNVVFRQDSHCFQDVVSHVRISRDWKLRIQGAALTYDSADSGEPLTYFG
jgi:hypothetical protein